MMGDDARPRTNRSRTRGEVERLHVRPDSWRQGIGTEQARTFFEAAGWELMPGPGEYNERLGITAVQYILALQ